MKKKPKEKSKALATPDPANTAGIEQALIAQQTNTEDMASRLNKFQGPWGGIQPGPPSQPGHPDDDTPT